MFENIGTFFKRIIKTEPKQLTSKDAAKERLHLVLMQDRANVSADFLELMKQEIIDVIKKYIDIDEKAIDVRLTNQSNEDGSNGAPALYANIPIINIKNEMKAEKNKENIVLEESNNNNNIQKEVDEVAKVEAKENEETKSTEEVKIEEKPKVEEKEELEPKEKEEIKIEENAETDKQENKEENIENDEEIDDVPTFDELLKQSEEEKEENKTKEKKPRKNSKKKVVSESEE